jgi:hypothetical protein
MIGFLVKVGDAVMVRADAVRDPLATGEPVRMIVDAASPGTDDVMAHIQDSRITQLAKDFRGPLPVPRTAILSIASGSITPSPKPGGSGPTPTSSGPRELSSPLALATGKRYAARVELEGMTAMFASSDAVVAQFSALGFSEVNANKSPPSDFPPAGAGGGDKGTWFVTGNWSGASRNVQKPAQVSRAWELA